MVVGFLVLTIIDPFRNKEAERKRQESVSYIGQMESLLKVQVSLFELGKFIEQQRERLQESEDLMNSLKAEQEKLKPVVETDRQVVEAILELQSQKSRNEVWKERGIGFFSGILASLIAAFIPRLLSRVKRTIDVSSPVDNP